VILAIPFFAFVIPLTAFAQQVGEEQISHAPPA
jgi:hypothetical protein